MMNALLRLAAVKDTKQAGELRGDTVHFAASSSALVLMTQNGIYRPLTQTASLSFTTIQQQTYRSKQIMDQADDNSLKALLTNRDQVRFREIVNTCTER